MHVRLIFLEGCHLHGSSSHIRSGFRSNADLATPNDGRASGGSPLSHFVCPGRKDCYDVKRLTSLLQLFKTNPAAAMAFCRKPIPCSDVRWDETSASGTPGKKAPSYPRAPLSRKVQRRHDDEIA
ncbi:hypothetical protein AVEN_256192-1 [Araneus ventricosus]|uniref:Uncharacterized protein n=1 Tax=Araneus ventricosus TaxID=182803 RepID=A0A4Y2TKI8_ARAVE|nr:hypothetical protein AVEN_256192-1 [Araneus ventricosus]